MVQGKTIINDSVFVEIAKEAMQKVEDVFRQERKGAFLGLTRIFTERFTPQIAVKKTEAAGIDEGFGTVALDVKISVIYGVNIPEVAKKVREKIVSEIETLTGYAVEKVDITIEKIIKPEQVTDDKKSEEEKEE